MQDFLKKIKELRAGMEAVMAAGISKDQRAVSLFQQADDKIGIFDDISMMELDKEYCTNPHSVIILFKELHDLLEIHFKATLYFSRDKALKQQENLVPAYTVSDYVFTIHDLKKLASGGEYDD
jgi:hypothetical protein